MLRCYVEELNASRTSELVDTYEAALYAAMDAGSKGDDAINATTEVLHAAEMAVLNCPVADARLCEAQRSIIDQNTARGGPFEQAMLAATMRAFDRLATLSARF